MHRRYKLFAVFAGVALVVGPAVAAVDGDAVHMALDSLVLVSAKVSVADAVLSHPKPPASNAEVPMRAPDTLRTPEISSIAVTAGGVINVHLSPAVGIKNGIVRYVPTVVRTADGKRHVSFACDSPNITDIASIEPDCSYRAAK